jgi:hypothetical protein
VDGAATGGPESRDRAVRPLRGASRLAAVALRGGARAGCVVAPPRARPVPVERTAPSAAMYFYPLRGQDAERLDQDRYACYRWASEQTGTAPGMTPILRTEAPPAPDDRSAERRGALTGAVVGATAGAVMSSRRQAPANAVLGAIFGAVIGTIAGAQQDRQRQVQPAPAPAASAVSNDFRRAMSACMAGRGYRVG